MPKEINGSPSGNSERRYRRTLLHLMLLDAKDRVNIILGEVLHTTANARFFACCTQEDEGRNPSVYLRKVISNASQQLEEMLEEDENKIDGLLADLSRHDEMKDSDKARLMTSIFMERDAVLDNLDKRLKSLSWIQHALSQELEAKPSYSPHLPIFKRREQQRVKEALISMTRDNGEMVADFFEKYLDKVLAPEEKAVIKHNQNSKLKKNIIIVWEHFNTTKYGLLDKERDRPPNTVILRVPQYFMDQKLYFPHVTHELVHLDIKDSRLFKSKRFVTLRRNLYLIFRDNPLYDDRETEKWLDNLLEEIFADVVSIALEGFSYLMSLFLTLAGQHHRFLLNRSIPPELPPFPWWIRIKMVLLYARQAFPKEYHWMEAVGELIDRYRKHLNTHFGFEPQQTNLREIMDYEQYICDVLTRHLSEYIKEILNVRKNQQKEEKKDENRNINYYNLKLNEYIIEKIKKISTNKSDEAYSDKVYIESLGPTLKSVKYYNINNIIWRTYIQSIFDEELSQESYFRLGAIFQLCYDHLELSQAWKDKKLDAAIPFEEVKIPVIDHVKNKLYEGYFIKARLDGAIKTEDGEKVYRLVQNDPVFISRLQAIIEQLPNRYKQHDLRVFKCLTSYDFFFIRKGVTTRRLIKDCPALNFGEDTGLVSYAERRILAQCKSIMGDRPPPDPNKEEEQSRCYSLVMEIRLKERWRLKEFLDKLTRDMYMEMERYEVTVQSLS